MKQTISVYQFRDALQAIRPDNFTYNGLAALFDYLVELEDDCGIEIELDPIAICCDFSEYGTIEEALDDYSLESENELYESTTVIDFNGGVIVQSF